MREEASGGDERRWIVAVCVAVAISWPSAAHAYRPFDSTDAAVANRGEMEIELGPVGYLAQGRDRWVVAPNLVLNYGFAKGWEVVLQGRQLLHVEGGGDVPRLLLDDTGLFLKGVLRDGSLQGERGPSLATELGPLLPVIHGATGLGAWAAVIVSQRWDYLTVHLNPAFQLTPAHTAGFFGGMILEGRDAWTVRPVAELIVETDSSAPTTLSGLLGGIWRVSDSLSLDAAVRRARIGNASATEVRVGLTLALPVGEPR